MNLHAHHLHKQSIQRGWFTLNNGHHQISSGIKRQRREFKYTIATGAPVILKSDKQQPSREIAIFDGMAIAQPLGGPTVTKTYAEYVRHFPNVFFWNKYHEVSPVFNSHNNPDFLNYETRGHLLGGRRELIFHVKDSIPLEKRTAKQLSIIVHTKIKSRNKTKTHDWVESHKSSRIVKVRSSDPEDDHLCRMHHPSCQSCSQIQ